MPELQTMSTTIVRVDSRAILDSRGQPTVSASVMLEDSAFERGIDPYLPARVRAAFRAAADRPACPLVCAAFRAAARRLAGPFVAAAFLAAAERSPAVRAPAAALACR